MTKAACAHSGYHGRVVNVIEELFKMTLLMRRGPTMCAMTGQPATRRQRPFGLPTRQTAKASIPRLTWPSSKACCKQMPTPVSTPCSTYALKLWPALLRYCDDGAIEIDNSAAERALRGVAIGRRNYLFAGADSGGERAAAIYSLIGTAKLTGVEPEAWLRHVLAVSSGHRPTAVGSH